MGSVNDTIEETIDYLAAAGKKVGVVKVRLYRPFCAQALINAIPDSVKQISVLDRTKEPGALGEPLYLDVVAALKDSKFKDVKIFTGRYGLGSKDTTPAQIVAVYENTTKKNSQSVSLMTLQTFLLKQVLRLLQHQKELQTVSSGDLELMVL